MSENRAIHWFRQDLRLADNPALFDAAQKGQLLPLYIFEENNDMGAASKWWLHHSLASLDKSLKGKLTILQGDPLTILKELTVQHKISAIHWNRCYEPWRIERDKKIKEELGICKSFNGSLLWEPWEIKKTDGTPYKVFTPFYTKGCLAAPPPREPLPSPKLNIIDFDHKEELNLLPTTSWDKQFRPHWHIGEKGAHTRLDAFLSNGIQNYKEGRNYPAQENVSRLSPHLHFGEISSNQVWYAAHMTSDNQNVECFCSELGWREFSYSLLYHNPDLPHKNLQKKFDTFPWRKSGKDFTSWTKGQTGIPIVDAGMRELWETGYMHNRVRMIVASFLVKNLLLDWRLGEAWFWDCLVDADLANNSASWQWVAGSGADAAPYFRIFNPVTQGQKFDPDGIYTKKYVPELERLPIKYLFNPWEAPEKDLAKARVILGKTYPYPIVDLKTSRERALSAFKSLNS